MRLSLEMDVYEELLNVSFEDIKVQSTLMASLCGFSVSPEILYRIFTGCSGASIKWRSAFYRLQVSF